MSHTKPYTCLLGGVVILLTGLQAPLRADTVLYSTSFEAAQGFTTGPIDGQDGWNLFSFGSASVESTFAFSGSQAVVVKSGTSQVGPYYSLPSTGPLIRLSADIALVSSSKQAEWQFAALAPGLTRFLGGIDIDSVTGDVRAISAGFPVVGTFARAVALDSTAWHNVVLLFDISAQTYSIAMDGVTLSTQLSFCDDNSSCTSGIPTTAYGSGIFDSFGVLGGGNDSGYLDDYRLALVNPTPEPVTATLFGCGLLALAVAHRRKHSARHRAAGRSRSPRAAGFPHCHS